MIEISHGIALMLVGGLISSHVIVWFLGAAHGCKQVAKDYAERAKQQRRSNGQRPY